MKSFVVLSHCTYDRSRLRGFDRKTVDFHWGTRSSCVGLLVLALDLEKLLVPKVGRAMTCRCLTLAFLEIGIVASVCRLGILVCGLIVGKAFRGEILHFYRIGAKPKTLFYSPAGPYVIKISRCHTTLCMAQHALMSNPLHYVRSLCLKISRSLIVQIVAGYSHLGQTSLAFNKFGLNRSNRVRINHPCQPGQRNPQDEGRLFSPNAILIKPVTPRDAMTSRGNQGSILFAGGVSHISFRHSFWCAIAIVSTCTRSLDYLCSTV
jgi:hypothetical protein